MNVKQAKGLAIGTTLVTLGLGGLITLVGTAIHSDNVRAARDKADIEHDAVTFCPGMTLVDRLTVGQDSHRVCVCQDKNGVLHLSSDR